MGTWHEIAVYCKETYGVHVNMEEGFFICPECGEPLYSIDFPNHCWNKCPVCGFDFFTDEYEEPEEDYYDDEEEEE